MTILYIPFFSVQYFRREQEYIKKLSCFLVIVYYVEQSCSWVHILI